MGYFFIPILFWNLGHFISKSPGLNNVNLGDEEDEINLAKIVCIFFRRVSDVNQMKDLYRIIIMQKTYLQQGGELCPICEMALQELKTLLSEDTVQKDVENFIKKNLCSKLGSYQKKVNLL